MIDCRINTSNYIKASDIFSRTPNKPNRLVSSQTIVNLLFEKEVFDVSNVS